MRIPFGMNRARREAFCGTEDTLYQRVLEILAPVLLLCAVTVIGVRWRALPQSIPTHFDLRGEPDAWGGKGNLFLLPGLGLLLDGAFALALRFPQSWNMGIRKTPQNAPYLYRATRTMMAELRFFIALWLSVFAVSLALSPDRLSPWIAWGLPWGMLVPTVVYLIRILRIRRSFQ